MDQYPYREEGRGAIEASILYLEGLRKRMNTFGLQRFTHLISTGDAVAISAEWRKFLGLE